MITEDYISFETAKLLKEKGFEEGCRQYWYKGNIVFSRNEIWNGELDNYEDKGWTAPTLQMAMKWLKEVHNLYVTPVPNGIGEDIFYPHVYKKFEWGWTVLDSSLNGFQDTEFSSPEEACEATIKYCLENLI